MSSQAPLTGRLQLLTTAAQAVPRLTGIAGLTLGGGFGYLTRRFGRESPVEEGLAEATRHGAVEIVEDVPEMICGAAGGGG